MEWFWTLAMYLSVNELYKIIFSYENNKMRATYALPKLQKKFLHCCSDTGR